MDRILIMTVGTGYNEEKAKSLAKALFGTIKLCNPTKTFFFGSEKSQNTVAMIKTIYESKYNEKFENYEFIKINDIDNINESFEEMSSKIKENKNADIYIDYTSGTKSMSVSAALCSFIFKTEIISISGTRGEDGIVISGTNTPIQQNIYQIYNELNLNKIKELFNNYRFTSAKETLTNEMVSFKHEEKYQYLLEIYDNWDKFQHKNFDKEFNTDIFEENIINQITKNKKAISIILKENHNLKEYYILADLINNSQRRYEEGKYDDAIARLYRSLELTAQIRLQKEYEINSSNIDLEKIKENVPDWYISKLKRKANDDDIIKIGLSEDYKLLEQLNDKLGKIYSSNNKYTEILKARNTSILAHGLTSTTKENYEIFKELVMTLALALTDEKINEYLEETKFPKFNIEK